MNRKHTQMVKGVAIVLMVWHHLFAFPNRIKDVSYQSMMSIDGTPIEQYIGSFGKICVAIFLFLSGYGLYKVYQKKQSFTLPDSVKRVGGFLKYYGVVFILFIPIGLIFFQLDPGEFLYNLFALEATYNGEWWFVPLYVELMIFFPFMMKVINKSSTLATYLAFIGFYLASFVIGLRDQFSNHELMKIFLEHAGSLLGWQLVFVTGILCAKHQSFEKVDVYLKKWHLDHKPFYLMMMLLCFYVRQFVLEEIIQVGDISFRYNNYNIADFVIAPMFIFFFIKLITHTQPLEKTFLLLGKHATVIWLTHTFFCYYYFQKVMYAPRYPLLILLWVLMVSLVVSVGINKLFASKLPIISSFRLERKKEA